MNATTAGRLRARLQRLGLAMAWCCCAATPATAPVVSVGMPPTTAPSCPGLALGAGQFLAPVRATGAVALQGWRFDLHDDGVAFAYLANQAGQEPGLSVDTPADTQPAPEPATAWLLAGALAALLSLRRHVRAPALLAATLDTALSSPRLRT